MPKTKLTFYTPMVLVILGGWVFFPWFLPLVMWASYVLGFCILHTAGWQSMRSPLWEMFLLKHGLGPCWNKMFLLSFFFHFKLFCEQKILRTFRFGNVSVTKYVACVLRGVRWLWQHWFQLAAAWDPKSLAPGVFKAAKELNFPAKWEALPVSAGCCWERAAGAPSPGLGAIHKASRQAWITWEFIEPCVFHGSVSKLMFKIKFCFRLDLLPASLSQNLPHANLATRGDFWICVSGCRHQPLQQLNLIHLPPSSPEFSPEVVFFLSTPHPRQLPWQPRDRLSDADPATAPLLPGYS